MMNDTHNNQKLPSNKQGKNFTSSERLGTCSMIAGIIGIVCSLFYLPMSLAYNQTAMPTGLVCGVIGILLALMARNADISPRKAFNARAIAGLVSAEELREDYIIPGAFDPRVADAVAAAVAAAARESGVARL